MGICASDLRYLVIRPALEALGEWTLARENLLLGTAAQESGLGFHLNTEAHHKQGIGLFQISHEQHRQLWDRYIARDPELASRVRGLASQQSFLERPDTDLAGNLVYATAIAWLLYKQAGASIPDPHDPIALACCWLRFYPSSNQQHSLHQFVRNYHTFVNDSPCAA